MSSSVERVRSCLLEAGLPDTITTFPEGTRTARDAAAAVGCEVAQIAKSIIFRSEDKVVLVITSGINRVDASKVAIHLARPVDMADATFVRERTGFAIGGVAPVGHFSAPIVLIDEDLFLYTEVWAAAGTPAHVFKTEPKALIALTQGKVATIKQ